MGGRAVFWSQLKQQVWRRRGTILIAPAVAGTVIAASFTGIFQPLEWSLLDQFFQWRPSDPPDPRILVVTIDERDITRAGQWPMADGVLADLIETIKRHQPRAIGLDLYRNLPVEPGHQDLARLFASTPYLVGVEKGIGEAVPPSPLLAQLGQVALADLVIDGDGRIRRGLLSSVSETGQVSYGLATKLALIYLQQEGVTPRSVNQSPQQVRLGQATFKRFKGNEGGYVNADAGGYQILINFRGLPKDFHAVSMTDVLEHRLRPEQVKDRIVLIGSTAISLNDFFHTAHSGAKQIPGVFLHANLTRQMISAAIDGRPLLSPCPPPLKEGWILIWAGMGVMLSSTIMHTQADGKNHSPIPLIVSLSLASGGLIGLSYGLFLAGAWMPVVSPFLAFNLSVAMTILSHTQRLETSAAVDGLTQIANRQYFDRYLAQQMSKEQPLALILCDVDYFKPYNDLYGHPAGDGCLQKVAAAMGKGVRRGDLVARYGGEEFVLVLPRTDAQTALRIAERVQGQVQGLEIPHQGSQVSPYVTLSCGVADRPSGVMLSPASLIKAADQALYQAKQAGRNRAMLAR